MSNKTKAQLEKENKLLKEKLKEMLTVEEKQKETEQAELAELSDLGFSLVCEEGKYKFVKLGFNRKTGSARILSMEDAASNNESIPLAMMEATKFLSEVLVPRLTNGDQ